MVSTIAMKYQQFSLTSVICWHTVNCLNSWPINRPLTGTTTPDQSGTGSNGNERVLHIPQSSRTRASPSDCLVSYLGHPLGRRSYSSADMQTGYSTVPADWAVQTF